MQIENFAFDISTNKVTSLVVKGNMGMAWKHDKNSSGVFCL